MGCMESLLRTRVDRFDIQDSLKLSAIEEKKIQGKLEEAIVSVEEMFADYPAFYAAETFTKMLKNGNAIPAEKPEHTGRVRMYTETGIFVGLYEWQEVKGQYKPVTIFLPLKTFILPGLYRKRREGAVMIYTTEIPHLEQGVRSAVTLGKFDGLHRGHQKLIHCISEKRREDCRAVVFTFDVSPRSYILKVPPKFLLTYEERRELAEEEG